MLHFIPDLNVTDKMYIFGAIVKVKQWPDLNKKDFSNSRFSQSSSFVMDLVVFALL